MITARKPPDADHNSVMILKESSPRPDHDFGLSWIKKDGQGRLFYMALCHSERIYAMKPMMEEFMFKAPVT